MSQRPKIAALVTIYHKFSHAQHILDCFLEGYGWNGRHHRPGMDLVSLYVDQVDENDLSRDRARRFPQLPIYPTVADALTLGGSSLAVDGVLLISEHGKYPHNEKGQHLYPRYELFRQIVSVFRLSGRTAPVFNDQHLSWKWEWCKEMVDMAREMGFALVAGSSLPVTWRTPALEMPLGARVIESMCVGFGGVDSYDFHALETDRCMVERRRGGKTGVRAVQLVDGDEVWRAREEGRWSKDLLESALSRGDTPHGLTDQDGRTQHLLGSGELPRLVEQPAAYFIGYRDGLPAVLLMLHGAVGDCCFAARVHCQEGLLSTQFLLTPTPNVTYAACLLARIEEMITTGRAPYPAERTLIVSGMLESCLASKAQGRRRLETPPLDVAYQPPVEPHHAHR